MSNGKYITSTARLDMGSSLGLTLPDDSCTLGSCHSCPNAQDCKCAPKTEFVRTRTFMDHTERFSVLFFFLIFFFS